MKHFRPRWLPGLATFVLLLAALLAPARGVRARTAPAPAAVYNPACSLLLQEAGAGATITITRTTGVCQPFDGNVNAAACTLGITGAYSSDAVFDIVAWDPVALAPDPGIVALRSRYFNISEIVKSSTAYYFNPPLVGRSVDGVAEPMPEHLAIDYRVSYWNSQTIHYQTEGPAELPGAMSFTVGGTGPRTPLPGAHPVLSHRICGGDATLQNLHVVQSVMTSSRVIGGSLMYEMAQRFRVPVATRLHWVEFALTTSTGQTTPIEAGLLKIIDAEGESVPPVTLPPALVQAYFTGPHAPRPAWQSHYDFDQFITLEPDHDYWLVFYTSGDYTFEARTRTGSESPAYLDRIGPLVVRHVAGEPWLPESGTDLNFRIVGEPMAVIGVDPAAATPGTFRLAISPQPSRGPVRIGWSGASGSVRFEVLDVRGRRVAGGSGAGTRDGRWNWDGRAANGTVLPPGVYFVSGRDAAGRTASERVVLVQ